MTYTITLTLVVVWSGTEGRGGGGGGSIYDKIMNQCYVPHLYLRLYIYIDMVLFRFETAPIISLKSMAMEILTESCLN